MTRSMGVIIRQRGQLRHRAMPTCAVALAAAFAVLLQTAQAYPTELECDRSITEGSPIMQAPVQAAATSPVRLSVGGTEIECGGSLPRGGSGLTFSWSGSQKMGRHYVVEAVASAGAGAWGIVGGSCFRQRVVDSISHMYTVPEVGNVTLRAAFADGHGAVMVTPDCTYSVPCPAGFVGPQCNTSLCNTSLIPSPLYGATSQSTPYVCVPQPLRQRHGVVECSLEETWRQLLDAMNVGDRYSTGGLGRWMIESAYEVWVCDKHSPCMMGAESEGGVCFIYSEQAGVFVPWGMWTDVLRPKATEPGIATTDMPAATPTPTLPIPSGDDVSFDFSKTVKQAHPGTGNEYKTLVYIELAGGLDGAAAFLNVKNMQEVHLWCSKRPTLSAEEYCECSEQGTDGSCSQFVLKDGASSRRSQQAKVTRLEHTDGFLAMTDMIGEGETGWLKLWNAGKMAVVPGVGRRDHGRSHFEVKDAAAKGVSIEKEKETSNGWLAKSIFGYNNLFCKPGQDPCPPPADWQAPPNVDGISLANAAAGPNALETSHAIAKERSFNHMSGLKNVEDIVDSEFDFDYKNPFDAMREMSLSGFRSIHHSKKYWQHRRDSLRKRALRQTDSEKWAERQTNLGLEELLRKEETIFQGLGIMKSKLDEYKANLETLCPAVNGSYGFPDVSEWASGDSDAEIGMQMRVVAILLVNGVAPKVFQVQQTLYDTHSNQGPRLRSLLPDLRTAVYTFVKAAENCGFWNEVLVTTFSDFGRRLEENSRKGTDHGWGSYFFVFGQGLRKQVLGYNPELNSSALQHIVPFQADAYDPSKNTKGDLLMTTDIESWNACLLQAMALPPIPRLGLCPPDMQIRDNLAEVPLFDEATYYKAGAGSSPSSPSGSTTPIPGDGDTSHLMTPLTATQVLHFARRVGYSTKSLGLEQYALPKMTQVRRHDFLT